MLRRRQREDDLSSVEFSSVNFDEPTESVERSGAQRPEPFLKISNEFSSSSALDDDRSLCVPLTPTSNSHAVADNPLSLSGRGRKAWEGQKSLFGLLLSATKRNQLDRDSKGEGDQRGSTKPFCFVESGGDRASSRCRSMMEKEEVENESSRHSDAGATSDREVSERLHGRNESVRNDGLKQPRSWNEQKRIRDEGSSNHGRHQQSSSTHNPRSKSRTRPKGSKSKTQREKLRDDNRDQRQSQSHRRSLEGREHGERRHRDENSGVDPDRRRSGSPRKSSGVDPDRRRPGPPRKSSGDGHHSKKESQSPGKSSNNDSMDNSRSNSRKLFVGGEHRHRRSESPRKQSSKSPRKKSKEASPLRQSSSHSKGRSSSSSPRKSSRDCLLSSPRKQSRSLRIRDPKSSPRKATKRISRSSPDRKANKDPSNSDRSSSPHKQARSKESDSKTHPQKLRKSLSDGGGHHAGTKAQRNVPRTSSSPVPVRSRLVLAQLDNSDTFEPLNLQTSGESHEQPSRPHEANPSSESHSSFMMGSSCHSTQSRGVLRKPSGSVGGGAHRSPRTPTYAHTKTISKTTHYLSNQSFELLNLPDNLLRDSFHNKKDPNQRSAPTITLPCPSMESSTSWSGGQHIGASSQLLSSGTSGFSLPSQSTSGHSRGVLQKYPGVVEDSTTSLRISTHSSKSRSVRSSSRTLASKQGSEAQDMCESVRSRVSIVSRTHPSIESNDDKRESSYRLSDSRGVLRKPSGDPTALPYERSPKKKQSSRARPKGKHRKATKPGSDCIPPTSFHSAPDCVAGYVLGKTTHSAQPLRPRSIHTVSEPIATEKQTSESSVSSLQSQSSRSFFSSMSRKFSHTSFVSKAQTPQFSQLEDSFSNSSIGSSDDHDCQYPECQFDLLGCDLTES